jgi:hypothetical protein
VSPPQPAGLAAASIAALALLGGGQGVAEARPPAAGVVTQAPLAGRDFKRMQRGGVETLRFILRWRAVEPARGVYDWAAVDAIVAGAARRGVTPLPVVYGSPAWVAEPESHPPLDSATDRRAWRGFLGALVDRYGPGGSLWAGPGRALPIRRWQIWNEPNFDFYWDPRPRAAQYARLVAASRRGLDRADRRAELVLAGVAAVRSGVPWWRFLRRLYEVPGFRRDFDAAALHPYSPGIRLLARQVELAREIMRDSGDAAKPLAITEVGWASGGPPEAPLIAGRRGQARLLERAFSLLERHSRRWRISEVDWYAWQDSLAVEPFCSFCEQAGLFDLRGRAKPAWRTFQRVVPR